MTDPVRVGIIGYGQIGQTHRQVIDRLPGARVVAVSRRTPIPAGDNVRWFADYRELVRQDDIDLVVICTPSGLHADQAIAALDAGKGTVIEKPLALTVADGRRVVDLAHQKSLFLSVISQRRTEDAARIIYRALVDGKLGRPVMAEALVRWSRDQAYFDVAAWRGTRAMDGGVLMNQAIHAIDLICWFFGPVSSVLGTSATLVRQIDAEDSAAAVLKFANGAIGTITATVATATGTPAEVNVFGELGSVSLHDSQIARWAVSGLPRPVTQEHPGSGSLDPAAIGLVGHQRQWENIIAAFRNGHPPLVTGEDGLATLAVIAAIEESSRTGCAATPGFVLSNDWRASR